MNCEICSVFSALDLKSLLTHICRIHGSVQNFSCYCPVSECHRKFSRYDTLYRHVKKDHLDLYNTSITDTFLKNKTDSNFINTNEDTLIMTPSNQEQEFDSNDNDNDDDLEDDDYTSTTSYAENNSDTYSSDDAAIELEIPDNYNVVEGKNESLANLSSEVTGFILHLRKSKIPQVLVDQIVSQTASIVSSTIEVVAEDVSDCCRKNRLDDQAKVEILESISSISNPFVGLHSKYLQDKYLNENVILVHPVKNKLGTALKYVKSGGILQLKEVDETSIYIPILDVLQEMLCNEKIAKILLKKQNERRPGIYFDVCDGSFFKKSPFYQQDHPVFTILIFQDAVELCNPLGNRSGKHKVVGFYWTLLNIPPRFRSKLKATKLLALVNNAILKKYGFESVMKPFFEDLNKIFNGVSFTIFDEDVLCYGNVILCLGDTEGQQQIGGFKIGVGWSFRKCRFCFATADDVHNHFQPSNFINREESAHNSICTLIERTDNVSAKGELQTNYGIISRSCLSKINLFEVTKQLPHDIMHVLLEGIVPYTLNLSLSALMDQGLFNLENFNKKLKYFQFTYADAKSKPEPLKNSVFMKGERKLKFSAENSRIFLKILPFLIDDFVSKDDVFLQMNSTLSRIVSILFSPVISSGTAGYVEGLIQQHCQEFKSLFPEHNLIPKHHYLLEIPSYIEKFGPPIRYSCMRFEAMHKVFKSFTSVCNFSTLCFSLAGRYIKYASGDNESFLKSEREDGPAKSLSPQDIESLKSICHIEFPDHSYYLNWVVINGTKYIAEKCLIAIDVDPQTHLPVFGKLNKILCIDKIMFVATLYETNRFSNTFVSYVVTETDDSTIAEASKLLDYNIYQTLLTSESELMIPLKYDLTDIIEEHLLGHNPLHHF